VPCISLTLASPSLEKHEICRCLLTDPGLASLWAGSIWLARKLQVQQTVARVSAPETHPTLLRTGAVSTTRPIPGGPTFPGARRSGNRSKKWMTNFLTPTKMECIQAITFLDSWNLQSNSESYFPSKASLPIFPFQVDRRNARLPIHQITERGRGLITRGLVLAEACSSPPTPHRHMFHTDFLASTTIDRRHLITRRIQDVNPISKSFIIIPQKFQHTDTNKYLASEPSDNKTHPMQPWNPKVILASSHNTTPHSPPTRATPHQKPR